MPKSQQRRALAPEKRIVREMLSLLADSEGKRAFYGNIH